MILNKNKRFFFLTCFSLMLSSYTAFATEANVSNSQQSTTQTDPSFLTQYEVANSKILLPRPPAYNSPQFFADQSAYWAGRKLKGTPRWNLAITDANLTIDGASVAFSQALGTDISKENTPVTYDLINKLLTDGSGYAPNAAKVYYSRTRPFMFFHTHSCTPSLEKSMRVNGSYPSGHTSFGWATALILSEMVPQRQDIILKRGYDYGQSRVICGAHWQSDVDAGRVIGAELVARLHADKAFANELAKAKIELNQKNIK